MRSDKPGPSAPRGPVASRSPRPGCEPGVCDEDLPPLVGGVLTGTGLTLAQAAARLEGGEAPALSDIQRAIVERWIEEGRGSTPAMDDEQPNVSGTPEKDPGDWVTGQEPMTGPQASYLETLCREAGEDFDPSLSKAQASEQIDRLQARTNRG